MSEVYEEKVTRKSASKIGALLTNNLQVNDSQVNVYYSQNNWKTSEKVEIMVEENTTILQLIDSAIFKFKTEFYYDDIDEKNYILMILKKKTKMPNYDYPKCNPESLVMGYGKSNFCLVEIQKEENVNNINEENNKDENILKNTQEIKNEEEKDLQKKESNTEKKNKKNNKEKNKNKTIEKGCNKGCILF